jgi:PIN domain nuclease of toxin-antitoxin system
MGRQPVILVDTHALVWWFTDPDRLSRPARQALRRTSPSRPACASAITLFEIATMLRRGRLKVRVDMGEWLAALRSLPELSILPVTEAVACRAGLLAEALPGDPADRLIVATTLEAGGRLVTADQSLRDSGVVETVW